jgi:phosphate:Na+ symporter
VTAMLASIGKPREAVRAAAVHVFFNVAGVVLWFMFIPQLAELVTNLSPTHEELTGLARLGAETPRQIANAHTIFNIANTIIFLAFTTQIAKIVETLLPDKVAEAEEFRVRSKYLDHELLSTPALALDRVRLEVLHMGEKVEDMFHRIMPAILSGNKAELNAIKDKDNDVDLLYEQIIEYMGLISKGTLSDNQTEEFLALMEAVGDLENIGDIIETNLVELGKRRLKAGFSISKPTHKVLSDFHKTVQRALSLAIQSVSQSNIDVAKTVIKMQQDISKLSESAAIHQTERLVAQEPNRIPAYTIEVDIIEKQKRIYSFAKRMASTVYAEKGEDVPE